MANMINKYNNSSNSNSNSNKNKSISTNNGGEVGGGSGGSVSTYNKLTADDGEIKHLRDVCNILSAASIIPSGELAYDHIINLMRGLDLQDDGIVMNQKIKAIETNFCNIVRDESMLCESMEYINNKALCDGETALKFAMLFSSRNFDALAMKETKVRSAMLKILETNFINADAYRLHDKNRLYNSITLLGEYYHRVRLADNSPITILGESLISLLIREMSDMSEINARLAKLVLSQITLNGDIMRSRHKTELTQLLFHIRRNLIEQPSLKEAVKALLLMTLDLYYSNFKNLGEHLENMYTKYLIEGDVDEDNNNFQAQNQAQSAAAAAVNHQSYLPVTQQQHHMLDSSRSDDATTSSGVGQENGNVADSNGNNDSFEQPTTTKKWSEQVCEDSFCESEFADYACNYESAEHNNKTDEVGGNGSRNSSFDLNTTSRSGGSDYSSRRSFLQPRSSPRPLKQHFNSENETNNIPEHIEQQQVQETEDRDESKPLPRWRTPRFNRRVENEQENGRSKRLFDEKPRRHSGSYDEDNNSVRSEGGLRLYSINDRMKHLNERFERSTGVPTSGNYNNMVNSNWDRQSQRDDRSERSYISNYERGNYKRGGGSRYNGNRNTFDKPPRFQKQHHHQQHQQQQHEKQQHQHHGKNNNSQQQDYHQKIQSESWRRSNSNVNRDENCTYPDSQSRSSSRARTLPRPRKSNMDLDGGNSRQGGGDGGGESHYHKHQQRSSRNYNARYSSQSSLASEASSTLDRRHHHHHNQSQHQHQRNFSRRSRHEDDTTTTKPKGAGGRYKNNDTHQNQEKPSNSWNDPKGDESELVRNAAQQTANYMNYLSSKK